MTDIEKIVQASSLEELNRLTKAAAARKKQLKGVGNLENQAILRGLVAKVGGWDAFKVDIAVVRKEEKDKLKNKAEADLAGLADDEDDDEADERVAA
jgi:hypothetical protein